MIRVIINKMITKEKADLVINTIKEISKPDKIYLFGSYVTGKTKENSDLDVCIIKNNVKDKHKELLEVKRKLFNIGIPLDILLLNQQSFKKRQDVWGTIQYEIVHNGVKVYEK